MMSKISLARFQTLMVFLTLLANLSVATSSAQIDTALRIVACDCKDAIKIPVSRVGGYGVTRPPQGYGEVQEVTAATFKTKTVFSEEHNSAWYLLTFEDSGEAIIEIFPFQRTDDYDFLLFPFSDSTDCAQILAGKLKPVRGNLSRNDTATRGVTGLSGNVKDDFYPEGPGSQFSRSLQVKTGDKYFLVLDNVYPDGKGHRVNVSMVREVDVRGKVVDEEGQPRVAEITLYDSKGLEQQKTMTDTQGRYQMIAKIQENRDYNIIIDADGSFFAAEKLNTSKLSKERANFISFRSIVPKLKKGNKYTVGNLNFFGDEAVLVPQSIPSLTALYHLMKKNKKLVIQIEGHVNGIGAPTGTLDSVHYQELSDARANTVYQYLKHRGIQESRMSTVGYGDKFMLFPTPRNFHEQHANRRVEIKVVSFE